MLAFLVGLSLLFTLTFARTQESSDSATSPCGDQYDHTVAVNLRLEYQKALKDRDYARLKQLEAQKDQIDLWAKTSNDCEAGDATSNNEESSNDDGSDNDEDSDNEGGGGEGVELSDPEAQACSKEDQNQIRISDITITANGEVKKLLIPLKGSTGKTQVDFISTLTAENCETKVYQWDFGDGTSSSVANPKKSYTKPGDYKVTLEVSCTSEACDDVSQKSEFNVIVFTVELITPKGDAEAAPVDSGDGQNEFTFDSAAIGVLEVNFKAKVIPSSVAVNEVKDLVSFAIADVGKPAQWDGSNPAGKASTSGSFLVATAKYSGLPTKNSDFGKKKTELLLEGAVVETVEIEVFFDKQATNNSTNDPNWFFYWKEGLVCGIPASAIYDPSASFGYVRPGTDTILRLGPDAATTNTGPEVYTHKTTSGNITVTGVGKGIASVAETVEHEIYHLTIYTSSGGATDSDGDGVANGIEPTLTGLSTLVNDGDTYGMSSFNPVYISYGDNEVRARKKEVDYSVKSYPEKDWANPGSQSKNQFGPTP